VSWLSRNSVGSLSVAANLQLVSLPRRRSAITRANRRPLRILVTRGRVSRRQLRICGLTENDLMSAMRQQGIRSFADVSLALYERAGRLTIVPASGKVGEQTITNLADAVPQPRAYSRTGRATGVF
jgi:Protein of unknown function (DUF421)